MTEKEKMLAGLMYDPGDPQLFAERIRARQIMRRFNITECGNVDAVKPILAELCPNAGPGFWVEPPFYVDYGSNIHTGEGVFLNFDCVLLDVCPIRIGQRTMFGPGVHLYTATHPLDADERISGKEFGAPITIGEKCWIGGAAVICPGVTIGDRVVIGAGAVVTKDIPSDTVAHGNPARVRKHLR